MYTNWYFPEQLTETPSILCNCGLGLACNLAFFKRGGFQSGVFNSETKKASHTEHYSKATTSGCLLLWAWSQLLRVSPCNLVSVLQRRTIKATLLKSCHSAAKYVALLTCKSNLYNSDLIWLKDLSDGRSFWISVNILVPVTSMLIYVCISAHYVK